MSLIKIQSELKAPKSLRNNFGKYNYRSCECILEALKPILLKYDATLTISDEVKEAGDYVYIEASCILKVGKEQYQTHAQAGIEKAGGMALPQAFGSASSYARKYCLNGLFMLDDTKDADALNTHAKTPKNASKDASSLPALKKLCKDAKLDFLEVAKWALAEKDKDINLEANAKALVANWDKVCPSINAWLITQG